MRKSRRIFFSRKILKKIRLWSSSMRRSRVAQVQGSNSGPTCSCSSSGLGGNRHFDRLRRRHGHLEEKLRVIEETVFRLGRESDGSGEFHREQIVALENENRLVRSQLALIEQEAGSLGRALAVGRGWSMRAVGFFGALLLGVAFVAMVLIMSFAIGGVKHLEFSIMWSVFFVCLVAGCGVVFGATYGFRFRVEQHLVDRSEALLERQRYRAKNARSMARKIENYYQRSKEATSQVEGLVRNVQFGFGYLKPNNLKVAQEIVKQHEEQKREEEKKAGQASGTGGDSTEKESVKKGAKGKGSG